MSRQMELQDGDYFALPWGRVEYHNNELHVVTTVDDPAGISYVGADGCKMSWKDKDGNEKVLLQMRQNAVGDGEFYLGALSVARHLWARAHNLSNALDYAMLEVATLNPDRVEFRVPVKFSAGVVGGATSSGDTLWSIDGRFFVQIQGDGNFVKYRALAPFDKAHAVPEWASGASEAV